MIKLLWFVLKPLWDRISARITIHGQRYTLLEMQFTERLYREMMDELIYLDLAHQRTHSVLSEILEKCSCLDAECKSRLLNELNAPYPIGVTTDRSDDVENDDSKRLSGSEHGVE